MKTQPKEWEKIFASYSQQRLNLQNIQTSHTTQQQKANNPIENRTEDLNRHFSRRHTGGQ